ncbi:hypothetical protein [Aetokthonos hydrillicola]|jgi:hypothetical protein|nr:hypothetical protein [Aetokthonos hydrillicola]
MSTVRLQGGQCRRRSLFSSAHTSIQGALAFALASGQSILGAAIN